MMNVVGVIVAFCVLLYLRPKEVGKFVGGLALFAFGLFVLATMLRVAYLVLAFIWS